MRVCHLPKPHNQYHQTENSNTGEHDVGQLVIQRYVDSGQTVCVGKDLFGSGLCGRGICARHAGGGAYLMGGFWCVEYDIKGTHIDQ